MRNAVNNEPTYYNSLYRHGVDEKRRVQIPAKWRPEKTGTELTLMLWPKERGPVFARFAAGGNGEDGESH